MIENILQILETNSRTSIEDIARQIGATPGEVKEEIKKAEEKRIILKYKALVDWSKLGKGKDQVMALVEIKAAPRDNKNFDDIAASIYKFKQVRSVLFILILSSL